MHSEHIDQTSGVVESSDDEDEEFEAHFERRDPVRQSSVVADGPVEPIITFQAESARVFPSDNPRKRKAEDIFLGALSPSAGEEACMLRYPHLWPIKHTRRTYEEPSMDVNLLGGNSQ